MRRQTARWARLGLAVTVGVVFGTGTSDTASAEEGNLRQPNRPRRSGTPASRAPDFVDLADVSPDIAIDMRYAGAQNFLGRPVRGYGAPRCLLTRPAAAALGRVQRELFAFGVGLLLYDCYRPQRAVDDFVTWSRAPDDAAGATAKTQHYPAVPKTELFARGYIAVRSGHSRGSTVDVTLVPLGARPPAPSPGAHDCRKIAGPLAPDGSLDMGTTFDCFDERSHANNVTVSGDAHRNRRRLRRAMAKHGFLPYAKEWWHFTLSTEPYPETTFDLEITSHSTTPASR
jgi:D-alanyl-D-alanine dipeptidase